MKNYSVLHLTEKNIKQAILTSHTNESKRVDVDIELSPEFCQEFVKKLSEELLEKIKGNDNFDQTIEWAQNELGLCK